MDTLLALIIDEPISSLLVKLVPYFTHTLLVIINMLQRRALSNIVNCISRRSLP
ncbi:hypothetical protein LNP17_17785 [Klebsiella variicola subsp. variicola]|nr:hypothetical protein [Klebsiella variicola subsp. variicola]